MPKLSPFIGKKTKIQVGYLVGVVAYTCNLSTLETETEESSEVQGLKGRKEVEYSECFKIQDHFECYKMTSISGGFHT